MINLSSSALPLKIVKTLLILSNIEDKFYNTMSPQVYVVYMVLYQFTGTWHVPPGFEVFGKFNVDAHVSLGI